ncbi:MAG: hypothetical protein RIR16_914 [Actinomycetota bacterium]|jgi:DNA repair protein RecN (Recombination protein N)
MIEEIYIRDLGVIEQSRLEFSSGFTALTGETGAGKTMVLTALGLLLGDRADSSVVRSTQPQAYVEGRWQLPDNEALAERLGELVADIESGELIVNRSLTAEGRSRASVNGMAAPVNLLSDLAEHLVVIHGQSDQIRLKSSVAQRQALDSYAGPTLGAALDSYRVTFELWQSTARKLEGLKQTLSNRDSRAEELADAINRIDNVNPQPGEPDTLLEKIELLNNLESLRSAVSVAHEALTSDDSDAATALLGQARKQLEQAGRVNAELTELAARLSQLEAEAREISSQLGSFLISLEVEGENDIELLQSRRSKFTDLQRRFGESVEEILAYREQAKTELENLDQGDLAITRIEEELAKYFDQLKQKADLLTSLRKQAAENLVAEVNQELKSLAMPGASLVIEISPDQFGGYGQDQISILLSSYPGAEPRPLGKGASGGELSRIMLAIEVVLAKGSSVPTFIFDEVDAGVGGSAAIEVGRRLAKLAKSAQVIVVTHLAQVAAFADRQLTVEKSVSDSHTVSGVGLAEGINRERELARMLSGLPDSPSALEHAIELLQLAQDFRHN